MGGGGGGGFQSFKKIIILTKPVSKNTVLVINYQIINATQTVNSKHMCNDVWHSALNQSVELPPTTQRKKSLNLD